MSCCLVPISTENDTLLLNIDEYDPCIFCPNFFTGKGITKVIVYRTKTDPLVIGSGFLMYCSSLIMIDMSSVNNLQSIGSAFLFMCYSLVKVILPNLNQVKIIGSSFMAHCRIKSLDLSSFPSNIVCEERFLACCFDLETIYVKDLKYMFPLRELTRKVTLYSKETNEILYSYDLAQHDKTMWWNHFNKYYLN